MYARKNQKRGKRKSPSQHSKRSKGESYDPSESRETETPFERSGARLETNRRPGKGRNRKTRHVKIVPIPGAPKPYDYGALQELYKQHPVSLDFYPRYFL